MKALTVIAAVLLILLVTRLDVVAQTADSAPNAELSPVDVVNMQLAALADNDNPLPNSGIATVFRFASPSNKEATGPLDRFTMMVKGDPYRDMLNHRQSELMPAMESPSHTLIPVRLVTREGKDARYVFVLTRQQSEACKGCWMTDAVMPVDDRPAAAPIADGETI